jgi:hypothetical protein
VGSVGAEERGERRINVKSELPKALGTRPHSAELSLAFIYASMIKILHLDRFDFQRATKAVKQKGKFFLRDFTSQNYSILMTPEADIAPQNS